VLLAIFGIALSVTMILGVERIRQETRQNFINTVAGTDLIVGGRTSPVQLLLYSVFRIGDPTAGITWPSFEKITRHPMVAWAVPVSLGDSHRGFRVVGTTRSYFEHLQHGDGKNLLFAAGAPFEDRFEAVIGAEVASALGYSMDATITVAHGTRDDGLSRHAGLPFSVTGILARSGTPADRSLFVTLDAIEAIHVGWESGIRVAEAELSAVEAVHAELEPDSVTAFFMGLKRRSDVLQMQRAINGFPDEPLLAILPGVALNELWRLFSTAELALIGVAAMTVATGLIGMVVTLLTTLNERRREMAVMRAVGASPRDVFGLFAMESVLIGLGGAVVGYGLLTLTLTLANPLLGSGFGLQFSAGWPSAREAVLLLLVLALAAFTGCLPAWRAYRLSLQDGLNASG
jgi:putative ABC transport system permease protein